MSNLERTYLAHPKRRLQSMSGSMEYFQRELLEFSQAFANSHDDKTSSYMLRYTIFGGPKDRYRKVQAGEDMLDAPHLPGS